MCPPIQSSFTPSISKAKLDSKLTTATAEYYFLKCMFGGFEMCSMIIFENMFNLNTMAAQLLLAKKYQ
jgi:hypothetical protein